MRSSTASANTCVLNIVRMTYPITIRERFAQFLMPTLLKPTPAVSPARVRGQLDSAREGGRSSAPRSITEGSAVLTSVWVQAHCRLFPTFQALRVVEAASSAKKAALRSYGVSWLGVYRGISGLYVIWSGVY